MSAAAAWEPRVRLQLFTVKYQLHLSDCGFGRREQPLAPPCDGCCVCDLFGASAVIVLLCYTVSAAPSVTQICAAALEVTLSTPGASNCRQTAGVTAGRYQGNQGGGRGNLSISVWRFRSSGSHL